MNMFSGTKIGGLLHEEHRSTLEGLYLLEEMIEGRRPPTLDAARRTALAGIARTLAEDVARHFSFEEERLFPIVRAAGAAFMVDMLMAEHEMIRPLVIRMGTLIDGVLANGAFRDDDWDAFRDTARDLIERETFHIQKEEMGLLGALEQVLESDLDEELAAIHAMA